MFGSKLDLFKKEWLDVVFEGRNKDYGAYTLRKLSARATNIGMIIVFSVAAVLTAPRMFNIQIFPEKEQPEVEEFTEVTLEDLDIPEEEEEEEEEEEIFQEEEEEPQQIAQDLPAEDLVRFPEPEVVPEERVKEEVASQEELQEENKTPARITLKGTGQGTTVPKGEFGSKKQDGQITGSAKGDPDGGSTDPNKIFKAVEVEPEPPGGMAGFIQWVARNYVYPQGALDAGVSGTIQLSFVVEKDGSLTDIKVVRDMSYGTGDAAVRVLKKAPKWSPGIQNGRPVRVAYTLPIKLNIQQ